MLKAYDGKSWRRVGGVGGDRQPATGFRRLRAVYVASGGETSINLSALTPPLSYQPGLNQLSVFVENSKLVSGTDYFETSGTQIDFPAPLNLNDVVEIIVEFNLTGIAVSGGGGGGGGGGESLITPAYNNSGSTLNKLTPVRVDSFGNVSTIDVSVDVESLASVGVAAATIGNLTTGDICIYGRIENVTTTGVFGDALFVSKTGGVTANPPTIGIDGFVSGDWVIRVGVIIKNNTVPANKDVLIAVQVVGQL